MPAERFTCPTCNRTFEDSECWVWNTGDPEMQHPGEQLPLFPVDMLEFPCGHSKEISQSPKITVTAIDVHVT